MGLIFSSRSINMQRWEHIAESLRQELAGYGGILHLFEVQQRALTEHNLEEVLSRCPTIEALALTLSTCRRERERRVSAFAVESGRPPNTSLRALLDLIEVDARPLLQALIDEIDCLLQRVRDTSRHSHELLTRALEMHRQRLQGEAVTSPGSPMLDHLLAEIPSAETLHATG